MPKQNWTIEEADAGRGLVCHHAAPRFQAFWTTGREALADIDGPCWSSEGSDDEDAIHLYAFQWHDPPPRQSGFHTLMTEAATVIDNWIVAQL